MISLCVLLIGAIALVDFWIGPQLSFSIFYLIPIALGAWWGGFALGILFSLMSTLIWHTIALHDGPPALVHVYLWNDVVRFGFFVITSSLLARLRMALLQEQALARTDALTGAANGRTFYEQANLEIRRAGRTLRPFTLVYLDLDNFKEVNDRRGHLAGDELLQQVAHTIHKSLRSIDRIARLGGDEFALLLPETDGAGAIATLTKLREALLREATRKEWPITYSIGAATFLKAPRDVHMMIQHVDALMYHVKRSGKNRIEHEVVHNPDQLLVKDSLKHERRATVRIICNHIARVSVEDSAGAQEGFARILNISPQGIGLRLDYQLAADTVLTIEPLCNSRVKTLLGRVIRTEPDEHGWYHGCALASRLAEKELRDWMVEATLVTSLDDHLCGSM
jgi:diguanylate cyclase (GGDEF)-like protein